MFICVMCCSEDREFKATLVIRSPLVKTPLTLQLMGRGSFDEMYKSELMSSVTQSPPAI